MMARLILRKGVLVALGNIGRHSQSFAVKIRRYASLDRRVVGKACLRRKQYRIPERRTSSKVAIRDQQES
jgi:hypothetical protein